MIQSHSATTTVGEYPGQFFWSILLGWLSWLFDPACRENRTWNTRNKIHHPKGVSMRHGTELPQEGPARKALGGH